MADAPPRLPLSQVSGRAAVLYPAVAEAAHRVGAEAIGLVDIGRAAALNLTVDRVGVSYSNGQHLGDRSSPVQHVCTVVGPRSLPEHRLPPVVARVGVHRHPIDVTDADDVAAWRDSVAAGDPDRLPMADAEVALAATAPPLLLRGDVLALLPQAVARLPDEALPVVTTTWSLALMRRPTRRRFLDRLTEAAADRPAVWISAEGVGVAPEVPTLGDRPASGHSIVGLAVFDGSGVHTEALGRCWSQGQMLSWLAGH